MKLYSFTAKKYEVSDYYTLNENFIEKYFRTFPNETVFAKAVYKKRVISSALILLGVDIAHYHFAANDPEYISLQGSSLLIYTASLFAAKKGKKLIDLGRARTGSALETFKRGFVYKGKMYPYSIGTKIRNTSIYSALVEQVGGAREGHFPAYRRD